MVEYSMLHMEDALLGSFLGEDALLGSFLVDLEMVQSVYFWKV